MHTANRPTTCSRRYRWLGLGLALAVAATSCQPATHDAIDIEGVGEPTVADLPVAADQLVLNDQPAIDFDDEARDATGTSDDHDEPRERSDRDAHGGEPAPADPSEQRDEEWRQLIEELAAGFPRELVELLAARERSGYPDAEGEWEGPDEIDGPVAHASPVSPHGLDGLRSNDPKVFDIDRFEQNIRDVLDDAGVGYAYSIGRSGTLHRQDGDGPARIGNDSDAPGLTQSPTKPMTVASMSKTITTVAVLRLLEDEGIDVDDAIGPWLPGTWERGNGVDQITFRELMTHTSGIGQSFTNNGDSRYETLREVIATDLGSKSQNYSNPNFGIFRLIVPNILGFDFSEAYDDPPSGSTPETWDLWTGAIFHQYISQMLSSIGVTGGCVNWDPAPPTLLYGFPYDGDQPGWEPGDYLHRCGGYGFFLSAEGLNAFMSHLRYGDLLSPSSRKQMVEGGLGLRSWNPSRGTSIGHRGRWATRDSGGRVIAGMTGCMMSFDIHVDVSLLINFRSEDFELPCNLILDAFDTAWVTRSGK